MNEFGKRKTILIIIASLIVIVFFLGVSYALWVANFSQTNENLVSASCFQIEFREDTQSISLQNTFPITDEDGKKLPPYTFTITNICEAYASYQVNLEVLNTSTLTHYEYVKVALEDDISLLSDNDTIKTTLDNASTSFKLTTGYLDHNESVTYNLRLWIDENVTLESEGILNTTFASKITVTASYIDHMPSAYELCIEEYGEGTFLCNAIADLDEEKCPTVNEDGTINVTSENQDGYVCSAPDDYGVSYYYRGNVTNNYVKFGQNESGQDMYWRIIRINGDGSIRMIYDGTSAHANGEANDDRNIGTSIFNDYLAVNKDFINTVSYTYNNHQNDSDVKAYVDAWYEKVFLGSKYETYISDEIFCNSRLDEDQNGYFDVVNSLYCKNEEDRYTVDESKGNGGLKYPIGLVTVIEGKLAGGVGISGVTGHYLDDGSKYWTMTPNGDLIGIDIVVHVIYQGMAGSIYADVTSTSGVKPVINLKPNSLKLGDGTASNPYRVE